MAAKPDKSSKTRLELFQGREDADEERPELDLPEVEYGANLIDVLFKVGPSTGGEAITFQELDAWSAGSGVVLDPWERETLRRLSGAYLAEYEASRDPQRGPPSGQVKRAAPAAVSSMIEMMMARYEEAPAPNPAEASQPAAGPSPQRSPRRSAEPGS